MNKIWYLTMLSSTASLGFLGIISNDGSVMPFVVTGTLALFATTIEGVIKTAIAFRAINEKQARLRLLKAQHMTRPAKTEAEIREELKAKMMAANELAKRQSPPNNAVLDS